MLFSSLTGISDQNQKGVRLDWLLMDVLEGLVVFVVPEGLAVLEDLEGGT